MKTLGYYNGHYDELENMMIPMNDRACFFGDGVYDAGPARNGKIFALQEHIDRFFRSAALLEMQMPVTKEELADLLNDLVKKMDDPELFVYYQLTRGTGIRNHDYTEGPGNLWVMIKPQVIGDCKEPIRLETMEDRRFYYCNIKTINLIPSCIASEKAKRSGCQETVLYRPGGRVTECAHSNVSILKDGVFITAPTDDLILPGIARAHLLNACKKLGIPVREVPYQLEDLMNADEIIVSSSSKLCLRALEVGGKPAGGKDIENFEKLRAEVIREFEAYTMAE